MSPFAGPFADQQKMKLKAVLAAVLVVRQLTYGAKSITLSNHNTTVQCFMLSPVNLNNYLGVADCIGEAALAGVGDSRTFSVE